MSDYEFGLTPEEERWVTALKRLAVKRPATLGLWGGLNDLIVVALTEDGGFMHEGDVICAVTGIPIPAGGGDPDWINVEDTDRPWAWATSVGKNQEDSPC